MTACHVDLSSRYDVRGMGDDIVLAISERALETILDTRETEPEPTEMALRVEIVGQKGVEFVYDLSFAASDAVADGHVTYMVGPLEVAIPDGSVDDLRGAVLDLPKAGGNGSLVIRNPNRSDPMAGVDIELTGDLANKVRQLLVGAINPALDVHGGYAELVGVDGGNNVYVFMGGGCQGCSASALTLRMGIRRSLQENIPEIVEVIDVTDHSQGDNPYYT